MLNDPFYRHKTTPNYQNIESEKVKTMIRSIDPH